MYCPDVTAPAQSGTIVVDLEILMAIVVDEMRNWTTPTIYCVHDQNANTHVSDITNTSFVHLLKVHMYCSHVIQL